VSNSASVDTLNNSMNSADGVSQPNDRVNVLGVGISPVNLDTAEDLIFNAIDIRLNITVHSNMICSTGYINEF